ncbi:DUF3137 domain-containing protein [bacterium]|nr:DUF3137 domain-containing protein [bacterium]
MRNVQELEELYHSKLLPQLSSLEELRKKLMFRYLIGILLLIIAFGSFFLIGNGVGSGSEEITFFLLIVFAIGGIIVLVTSGKIKRNYRTQYKRNVVTEIVKLINPDWRYDANGRISSSEYNQSDLFRAHYDRFNGDDLISGVMDKTDFKCSELHTEYKKVTTDSKGRRQEHWVTIFKGLFFHADFNKEFVGQTYVSPDFAEKFFGKFGQKFQKFSEKGDLIKLENPEFEREFKVTGSDQVEARYILTPVIMEALLKIKKQYACPVHFSFIGSRVYCALSISKDLFEPRIFSSGLKFKDVENMYHLFMVNQTIIQELNLNTRIWTKD